MKLRYLPKYIKNLCAKKDKNFKTEENIHSIIESNLIHASELVLDGIYIPSIGNYISIQKIKLGAGEEKSYDKYKSILSYNKILYIEHKKEDTIYLIISAPRKNYEYLFYTIDTIDNIYIKSLLKAFEVYKCPIDSYGECPIYLILQDINLDRHKVCIDDLNDLEYPYNDYVFTDKDIAKLTNLYYMNNGVPECTSVEDMRRDIYNDNTSEDTKDAINFMNNCQANFALATPSFKRDNNNFIFKNIENEDNQDDLYDDIDEFLD